MSWTQTLPTENGHYWFKSVSLTRNKPLIVTVRRRRVLLPDNTVIPLEDINDGFWSSRILPPEDSQPVWIDAVFARLGKTTPGAWERFPMNRQSINAGETHVCTAGREDDAEFIAHATEDIRQLLALLHKHGLFTPKSDIKEENIVLLRAILEGKSIPEDQHYNLLVLQAQGYVRQHKNRLLLSEAGHVALSIWKPLFSNREWQLLERLARNEDSLSPEEETLAEQLEQRGYLYVTGLPFADENGLHLRFRLTHAGFHALAHRSFFA